MLYFSTYSGIRALLTPKRTPLHSVLKVELSSLGGMKVLPYIVMFLMSNVGGLTGDWLIMQRKMSVSGGRKTVNTIGAAGMRGGGGEGERKLFGATFIRPGGCSDASTGVSDIPGLALPTGIV